LLICVGLVQEPGPNSGVKVVRILQSQVSRRPAAAANGAETSASDKNFDKSNVEQTASQSRPENVRSIADTTNKISGLGVKKNRRLKNNLIGDSQQSQMLCPICGKMVRALHVHMRLHQQSPFECTDCGRKFARSDYLTEHRRVHSDERPFLCIMCGHSFGRAANLRAHLRTHSEERRYPCDKCGKWFRRSSHRNDHIRKVHDGLRAYQCKYCPRAYSSASGLKMHMMEHTNERPYGCTMCPKRFKSTATLDLHSSVHTGDRRFPCGVCGRKFTQKSAARIHEMTQHAADGGRCHECEICGQRYSKRTIRDAHVRRHKGEKPHACSMCHWKFAYLGDLRNHMIKKHKVKRSTTAVRPQQSLASADNSSG